MVSVVYIQIDAFDLNVPKLDNIEVIDTKNKRNYYEQKKDQQRNEDMD